MFSDPKVQACLKKQGVDLSGFRPPNRQGSNGQPPSGGNGQPRSGQGPPNGGFRNSGRGQKLRAALQKCGVDFRGRPPNGQAPQGQGTTSTSAS